MTCYTLQVTFVGYGNKQDTRLEELREPVAAPPPPPKPESEKKKKAKLEDIFETNEGARWIFLCCTTVAL